MTENSVEEAMDLDDDQNPDEFAGDVVEPDHDLDLATFKQLRDDA